MFKDFNLNDLIIFFLYIIIFFITNTVLLKKKFLLDNYQSSNHKKLISNNNVPLSGGLILLLSIYFFKHEEGLLNYFLIFLIYSIGLFSDLRVFNHPLKRLSLQLITILIYLYFNKINIDHINLIYIDNFLSNYVISLLFTLFCFLILINGSNFIDGSNLQCSGYYFSVLIIFGILIKNGFLFLDELQIKLLFIFLISFIIFNFYNKTFLGDGGSYLLSFIVGVISIKFFNLNYISPYFIALLLWYPAFENLFTIIRRKFYNNRNVDQPDTKHLHHLVIKYLKTKKYKKFVLKNIFGFFVFVYNIIIFLIGSMFIYNSKIQILLIILSVIVYMLIYQKFKTLTNK